MDDQRDYLEEAYNRQMMHDEAIEEDAAQWQERYETDILVQKRAMFREFTKTEAMTRLVDKLAKTAGNYQGKFETTYSDISNLAYKMDIIFPNMRSLSALAYVIQETYGFDSDIVGNAHSIHESVTLGITIFKLY